MSRHPDPEELSASLDETGAGAAVAAHVNECPACRARLAELRSVKEVLTRPVPPPPAEVRERAIRRAVAEADEWAGGEPGPEATGRPAPVRSLPSATDGAAGRGAIRSSGARWWFAGSAAAAVLAAVLVGTALVGGGSKPASDTALSTGAPRQVPSLESASPSPPPGGVSGGDLGDVGDVATLKALVSPSLAVAGDRGTAGTVSPAGLAAASPSPSGLRVVGTRVCEVEARTARPQLGLVAYAANVRFQDTDAVVLGFGDGVGAPPITLLVLAPGQSCRVLAESTIP